jgi:membrane protein implicated in regulation of membrane protease activity
VCAGIVALMMIFVATLMYIGSLAEADAALALFGRYAALVVSALALLPAVASILFFVRYRRTRRAFNLEWQRFVDERHQPALSNGSLQQ